MLLCNYCTNCTNLHPNSKIMKIKLATNPYINSIKNGISYDKVKLNQNDIIALNKLGKAYRNICSRINNEGLVSCASVGFLSRQVS